MIRMIAAIDGKRGVADEQGIPWNLPQDKQYFRSKTEHSLIVMGYRMYLELSDPLPNRKNMVVTDGTEPLREGFEPITDLKKFLKETANDIWVVGGAVTYETALPYAKELYLTELQGDFGCTKFFPTFKNDFKLKQQSGVMEESGISYRFCVYTRR